MSKQRTSDDQSAVALYKNLEAAETYAEKQLDIHIDHDPAADEWDAYVMHHTPATFFHLTGWQRVVEKTFAYRSFSCAARCNGRITGVLPLFLVRQLPFGHALVSAPLAVYGGLCADDIGSRDALLHHAKALAQQLQVRYLELRQTEPLQDLPQKDLYVTFRRAIDSDPEKNMAAIPRKQRRMIRQGDKYGLRALVGGEELLERFYQIYAHSVRRLGTPVYPRNLFADFLREFDSACRILAVFHNTEMVAGVMTFFFRDQVLPYYGGALQEALPYAVNDFMYWQLMCYAAEQGYRLFDFGRSKQGTGAYDFKRHWGFEPTPLPYQYYLVRQKTLPNINPLDAKFALPIEVWKRLPLGCTQWLGPKLVRFFP
jgi:FemAB-related protein (PEP-CTERM system-associated)